MEVKYNVSGERRKEMVSVVSEALGGWSKEYMGAPSFSYQIGDFEITRDGTLVFADRTDTEMVEQVLEALAKAGFECEGTEKAAEMEERMAPEEAEQEESDSVCISISLPRDTFTDTALTNLDNLLESKGNLIKKSFGIDEATYTLTDDCITFNWLSGDIELETAKAYQDFIGKLCEMARTQKRVTAKAKVVDNEKYAFRCFLLRLGLIGNEYKTTRKILLQNLSGNASFKSGHKKEAAEHEEG